MDPETHELCEDIIKADGDLPVSVYINHGGPTFLIPRAKGNFFSLESSGNYPTAIRVKHTSLIKPYSNFKYFLNYILSAIFNDYVRLFGNILYISCGHLQICMTE